MMQMPTPAGHPVVSPKRKRSDYSVGTTPSPSRLKTTNLPGQPPAETDLAGEGSPRTVVASHFQNLDLDLDARNPVSELDLRKALEGSVTTLPMSPMSRKPNGPVPLPSDKSDKSDNSTPRSPAPNPRAPTTSLPAPADHPPLQIPPTPHLRPTTLSALPPPLPQATTTKPPRTPSPALSLWWKDTEITGHDPTDPTDDGYGINGVGFLPTPAIASARAERRKRQVVEWKNREAREARQRRSEMRRRRDGEGGGGTVGVGSGGDVRVGAEGGGGRKVRFLET